VFCPTGAARPVLGNGSATAATVALGPVMHEVRISITSQHKTRFRLMQTDDPLLGRRLEVGHRIGVLEPWTEVSSRFTSLQLKNGRLYSEDNAYEVIRHNRTGGAATDFYPSQASVFLRDDSAPTALQLSLALDRSKGVANPTDGCLEVMHHRRGGAYDGTGGTVVLDDTDRIFTETFLSIGKAQSSNALRATMKLRLNNPLVLGFTTAALKSTPEAMMTAGFAESLNLQTVRATALEGDTVLVRLQHMFSAGEDPVMSQPVKLSLLRLFPALMGKLSVEERSLNGLVPRSELEQSRERFPAHPSPLSELPEAVEDSPGALVVNPFELRTFVFF